jgi:hypothetical protein
MLNSAEEIIVHRQRNSPEAVSAPLKVLTSFAMAQRRALGFALLLPGILFLLFYNLGLNPRPWQDDGGMMTLAKTLVNDGVYAIRSNNEYQSFGAVQSVGPTVILPVAASFKALGIGLWQGRIVTAIYSLFALLFLYSCAAKFFGVRPAIVALVFLLSASNAVYVLWSRYVLGDVPALAFFLAACLAWWRSTETQQARWAIAAGLLLGGAMLTKSQYVLMAGGGFVALLALDVAYYKRGLSRSILITLGIALTCYALWQGWQYLYFGPAAFAENAAKLAKLSSAYNGFSLYNTTRNIRALLGQDSGHLYAFWGLPLLVYGLRYCLRGQRGAPIMALLIALSLLSLAYVVFWSIFWSPNLIAPTAVVAVLFGKLFVDVAVAALAAWRKIWREWQIARRKPTTASTTASSSTSMVPTIATTLLLFVMFAWTMDELQGVVRFDVLDTTGRRNGFLPRLGNLAAPQQAADFIAQHIPKDAVIETWERELGLLTDHRYHFLDQVYLARSQRVIRGHKPQADYVLGQRYFEQVKPNYLILGHHAHVTGIYDMAYVAAHATLIGSMGEGELRYDVYRMTPVRN